MNNSYQISDFISLTCSDLKVADLPKLIEKDIQGNNFNDYYELAFDLFLNQDLRWRELDDYIESSMVLIDKKLSDLEKSDEYLAADISKQQDLVFEELMDMKAFYYNNDEFDKKLQIFDDVYLSLRGNSQIELDHLISLTKKLDFKQISLLVLKIDVEDLFFYIEIDPSVNDGPVEDMVNKNILLRGNNIPIDKRGEHKESDLDSYFLINLEYELFKNKDLRKLVRSFNFVLMYIEALGNSIVRALDK